MAGAIHVTSRIGPVMKQILMILACLIISGCLGMPETVKPVNNFETAKYLKE